jgi:hypothetical protein
MILGLMRNAINPATNFLTNTDEIKFSFLKNMIKKDMEVVSWHNSAVKVFGEFQIYSDFKSELNSFDHIITFLTGRVFEYAGDSIESYIACKCPEHFLTFLITKNYKFEKSELDDLATKYTQYMLETVALLNAFPNDFICNKLMELEKKYFGGNDPTAIWKYIDPKFLN